MKFNIAIKIIIALLLSTAVLGAAEQVVTAAHTEVSLINEYNTIVPGQSFDVAIRMRMDPEWHVYWQNPGDSGLAPNIKWTLPAGWTAEPIQWPTPHRIDLPPLAAYGYEDEVVFLVTIHSSNQTPTGTTMEWDAKINWLTCKIDCVPGHGTFHQSISLNTKKEENPAGMELIKAARQALPHSTHPWQSMVDHSSKAWHMRFMGSPIPASAEFLPERSDVIQHAAKQIFKKTENGFTLEIPKSNLLTALPERMAGILKVPDAAYLVDAPINQTPLVVQAPAAAPRMSLGLILIFALLGGLILNIMPCVLPVLSLKILSLVSHRYSRQEAISHGMAFTIGVLISFWILAVILLLIQQTGAQIGWGFQFQSPWFVGGMAIIFILFAANLFGFFEIGTSLAATGIKQRSDKGLRGSFFNGFFATVVATPCTAPFMGTAIAYALAAPAWVNFSVFTAMGIGMSLPMLLLSLFPNLLKFLPKPGPWMNGLKRILGVLMLLSAIWMLSVLGLQSNVIKKGTDAVWETYSPDLIVQLQQEGRDYFLDFTATWCLTCQVNDKLVLQNPKVQEAFLSKNITLVKADWTKYDPIITDALAKYGRNSIPLYVLYKAKTKHEDVLGETITVGGILKKINQ